jgi:hypothetical protein
MAKIMGKKDLREQAQIALEVEQDDLPVRGNALASGDTAVDRECEDAILARLDAGDVWAWAHVRVVARIELDEEDFEAEAALGGCSYAGEADFRACDYYADMLGEALDRLYEELPEAPEPMLWAEIDADHADEPSGEVRIPCEPGSEITLRLESPDAENGAMECRGAALDWLNSARLVASPKEDAIHCYVSIDDPRGALGFTVRRLQDGRIVIHCPYPEDTMPHVNVARLNEWGTLVVVDRVGNPRVFGGEE